MIDLIRSPFKPAFDDFFQNIKFECVICSPYITMTAVKSLVYAFSEKKLPKDIPITILTDISLHTLVQQATDISALLYLFENYSNTTVTYLPRIHAKVYISDKSNAIVASANFTDGGQTRNFEYGVRINDPTLVQRIYDDIESYKNLGAIVTPEELKDIRRQVENVRNAIQVEQKIIAQKLRLSSIDLQREIEDNLIRVRVKQKSINAVFSETLLYLLSRKPLSTEEINMLVKDIHPDLCDDTIDRVIDGKHYGKLWKHQVRNAQVTLRKAGRIFYNKETRLWHKVN